jgi:hypothetical protein
MRMVGDEIRGRRGRKEGGEISKLRKSLSIHREHCVLVGKGLCDHHRKRVVCPEEKNVGAEILWRRSSDRCPEIHFQILELQGNRHPGQCHDQQERSGGLSLGSQRKSEYCHAHLCEHSKV